MGSRYPSSIGHADHCANHAADSETLTIPGNGRREAFDRYVDDCLDATFHVCAHADGPLATDTLGTRTTTSVTRIADIVADELGLEPDDEYTGSDRRRGATSPRCAARSRHATRSGGRPRTSAIAHVRKATRELIDDLGVAI